MSFNLHLQCFCNQKPAPFDRAVFDEIFGPYIVERSAGFVRIQYPNRGGGADTYVEDTPSLDHMMFSHWGGDMFLDGMYELIKRTKSVIYWPNVERMSAVTDHETLTHLPTWLTDEECHPIVAKNWREITDAIARS